jgi:chromosome segregation ATPase
MKLTLAHYIAAAAVVIAITMTAAWLWSEYTINGLERDVRSAKTIAAEKESAAGELERRATEYKAKTEYLEQKVAEIQVIAQKQDEELKAISNNVDAARGDVHRARRTRSAAATAEDLCATLAELDHPCR